MKDFLSKIDNNDTPAGFVDAEDFNSCFGELENAVTPFFTLSLVDTKQLIKSIDAMSKATTYQDTGTENTILLSRAGTADETEVLLNGMTLEFSPAVVNTGASTVKIKTLAAKPLKYLGLDMPAGFLQLDSLYRIVFDSANDWFECEKIINSVNYNTLKSYIDSKPVGKKNLLINGRKYWQQRGITGGRKQVVLGYKNLGGSHTISWVGASTVTIKEATTLGASDALTTWDATLATGATSGTTVTLTAGKFIHVEFSTTDFDFALLEKGIVATNYPILEDTLEECLPYYEDSGIIQNRKIATANLDRINASYSYKVQKRIAPTVKIHSPFDDALDAVVAYNSPTVNVATTSTGLTTSDKSIVGFIATADTIDTSFRFIYKLNAEIFHTDDGVGIQYCQDRWYKDLP